MKAPDRGSEKKRASPEEREDNHAAEEQDKESKLQTMRLSSSFRHSAVPAGMVEPKSSAAVRLSSSSIAGPGVSLQSPSPSPLLRWMASDASQSMCKSFRPEEDAVREREATGTSTAGQEEEAEETCWVMVPLWSTKEEELAGTLVVDFGDSICSRLFGPRGHQRYFEGLLRYRRLVRLSLLAYNGALAATCAALLAGERWGLVLSAFVAIGALPGIVQALVSVNIALLKRVISSSQFWSICLLELMLWGTIGITLGGVRGPLLAFSSALQAVTGGPFYDAYHYRLRPSTGFLATYFVVIVLYVSLSVSMVLKVSEEGKMLRWAIGSRQLTGEDVIVNCSATILISLLPFLLQSFRARWQRDSGKIQGKIRKKTQPVQPHISPTLDPTTLTTGKEKRMRVVPCFYLQWPLVLQPRNSLKAKAVATVTGDLIAEHVFLEQHKEAEGKRQNQQLGQDRQDEKKTEKATADKQQLGGKGQQDLRAPMQIAGPWEAKVYSDGTDLFRHIQNKVLASCSFLVGRRRGRKLKRGTTIKGNTERQRPRGRGESGSQLPLTKWKIIAVQSFTLAGVCTIPVAFYLGNASESSTTTSGYSWLSPVFAACCLVWNAFSFLYMARSFNFDLLRLVFGSSFDFWFLCGQAGALFVSLCDAFRYDERCLPLLAWCLLYAACLFCDSIIPSLPAKAAETKSAFAGETRQLGQPKEKDYRSSVGTAAVTKPFLGVAILFPLLCTKCWFLYDLIFRDGSLHLRARNLLHITKYLEDGGARKDHLERTEESHILDFSTDSFIVARQMSLIVFSLPLLYHLVIKCSAYNLTPPLSKVAASSSSSAPSQGLDEANDTGLQRSRKENARQLYFLTASVSYEVPTSHRPRRTS